MRQRFASQQWQMRKGVDTPRRTMYASDAISSARRRSEHAYSADMASSLRLIDLTIPMRDLFANAGTTVAVRRVVLIGVEQDGITGWGEAAPFPGITTEDVGDVWDALHQQADLVARRSLGLLPATAEAAADQAHEDLTARQIGTQLWARLGGSDRPIPVTVAIGIQPSPALAIESIAKAVEAGFHSVKLKIGPGRDIAYLAAARDAFGELSIAADANGSYELGDPFLDEVDSFGLEYLEQPLGAVRLAEHGLLRERFETPICLDESMHTHDSARRAIDTRVADIVCLKPSMLGTTNAATFSRAATSAGIAVKVSGLIESSVGRSHTLALASMPGVAFADLTPPTWFLTRDVTDQIWPLADGTMSQHPGAGIGIDVDELAMVGIIERSATIRV